MRRAVIISAALHVLLLGFVIFGLPQFFRVKPPEQQVIAVEMVTPDQNQPAPKPQPKPEPPKAETAPPAPPPLPEPKPQRVETPPPPPPPVPEPKPRVVEAPPPPPPAPPQPATPAPKPPAPQVAAVTPEKMPAPAPTPKPKPTPPQPEAKPAPPVPAPKAKPQTQQDDFQALLKNLEKQKQQTEQTESTPQRQQAQPQQQQVQPAPQRQQASSIDQRRAAAGLAQMVKDQVTPCWNIPAGAKDARDLQIVVVIDLNPDGTLRGSPTISDASRYESDPFFRAAADSALRALRNPRCTPLKLPYEMYETWKRIEFTFDPKEVIG